MALMDRKIFRDIYRSKFRSLLIICIVAATIGLLTGMRAGYPMIQASYKENLLYNNVADGRFTFPEVFDSNNVSAIKADSTFMTENQINEIEGRIYYYTEIKYQEATFPCIVIGINYPNNVNKLHIINIASDVNEGELSLNNTHNAIIETRFAGSFIGQDVPFNANLTATLGSSAVNFTVKATGQDGDFMYVVDPISKMTLMGQLCVIWVDLSIVQDNLFGGAPMVNQILFTVEDRLNRNIALNAYDHLVEKFQSNGIHIAGFQFQTYDETDDREFFDADVGSVDKLGTIFGVIGLVVCSIAIFNTLTQMVQAQRRNIGLFMSLGSKPRQIIFHYVKITMVLSFFGIVLGIPLGYGLSLGMTKLVVRFFAIAKLSLPIIWSEYIFGGVIVFGVCSLFSALSAVPITKVTPRAAMSAFFNRITVSKEKFSEKLFGWIPGFRSIHMRIPLREIFLRKKKSAFTILAITTSMILLITSLSMVTNMYSAINDNFTKYNTADVQVVLSAPLAISDINNKIGNISDDQIAGFELYLSVPSKLSYENEIKSGILLECYSSNSQFRHINIIKGDLKDLDDADNTSIILGNTIASKYNIQLNDQISIGLLGNYSVKVTAFVGELIDYAAFWTLDSFFSGNISAYFGIPNGYVNGIMLDVAKGVDTDVLRTEMSGVFDIAQWIDSQQSQKSVTTLMESMMGILGMFVLVGMAIGVLFSFNTMYFSFISRENDFLSMKAMGAQKKHMRSIIFRENALLSFFSLIVTIPIGYFVYWWSMDYMLGDRFYMPFSIPWFTWPMVFLLSLISIGLATRRMMRKIEKLVLSDELRIRIVS